MKICLDPGHGGKDPGAFDHGIREADLNLALSLELRPILQRAGFEVVMTRETDVVLGLAARSTASNQAKADVCISVHHNASGASDPQHAAYGIETYAWPGGEGEVLARSVHRFMVTFTGAKDREVRANKTFWMLRKPMAPAVLLECGYVSNAAEVALLQEPTRRVRLACAIAAGLMSRYAGKS